MATIKRTFSIPPELAQRMTRHRLNWSAVVASAIKDKCDRLEGKYDGGNYNDTLRTTDRYNPQSRRARHIKLMTVEG